jgi:tetratricopeptide (TPR) repeat protein
LIHYGKGEYDKAIEYNEKAMEIWLKSLGNEHPNVALSFYNLGATHQKKGEYDKAIDYYEKAASIYDALKQPDDVKEIRDRISKIQSKLTDTSE